ncbi:hypothetical protein P5673_031257 [Acropora cervicornis]|uniref:Uncharacterized protein n=1 Tax=Acropora cervicornis TaxID=6130 RepID=A0AAD9USW7_ACRCE|nr:hypothetical protein P5673_031257 [Acropora cervicornis]
MLRYKQRVVKGFKAFSKDRKPAGPHHRGIRARLSTITPGKSMKSVPANLTGNLVDYWKKTQNASNIKCSVYLSKAALRIAKDDVSCKSLVLLYLLEIDPKTQQITQHECLLD